MRYEPPNREEERNLLSRAAAGDEKAWITIYERHRKGVRHVAVKLLKSDEEAADVAQDVWLLFQLWLPWLADNEYSNIAAWLYRVASNLSSNRRRATRWGRRFVSTDSLTPAKAEALVEEVLQRSRKIRSAEDAVLEAEIQVQLSSLLSETDYAVFKSAFYGAKPRETATDLGLPPALIHKLLFRIRARLRDHFQDIYGSTR